MEVSFPTEAFVWMGGSLGSAVSPGLSAEHCECGVSQNHGNGVIGLFSFNTSFIPEDFSQSSLVLEETSKLLMHMSTAVASF